MAKFRKKPIEIEAIQFNKNFTEIEKFCEGNFDWSEGNFDWSEGKSDIKTLEGTMRASIGDWIIKGINGEDYPCKPDIFEKTYESADVPESFLDRVIKEKAELTEKISKLKDFIENNPKFDELTNINRILLTNQFNAMELYLYALDSRIEFIND